MTSDLVVKLSVGSICDGFFSSICVVAFLYYLYIPIHILKTLLFIMYQLPNSYKSATCKFTDGLQFLPIIKQRKIIPNK